MPCYSKDAVCRTFRVRHTETREHMVSFTLLPHVSPTGFGECAAARIEGQMKSGPPSLIGIPT